MKSKPKDSSDSDRIILFSSFGVSISVEAPRQDQIDRLRTSLSDLFRNNLSDFDPGFPTFNFCIRENSLGELDLFKNESIVTSGKESDVYFDFVETQIRLAVAEYSNDYVFVHSGAVSKDGLGIVIPGHSNTGKTTLVRALIESGYEYYSDEYAIFDKQGLLNAFPKPLSIRETKGSLVQIDRTIEELGGSLSESTVRVGLVFLSRFEKDAIFQPKEVSRGEGVLQMLEHTLPIRRSPQETLQTLNTMALSASFYQSKRNDVNDALKFINKFVSDNR